MTCEKSLLRDQKKHWQIAYISNLSDSEKKDRMESIEKAVEKRFAESTVKKWKKELLKWKEDRDYAKMVAEKKTYFDMVEDKTNWKLPIDSWIPKRHLEKVKEAVEFYAFIAPEVVQTKGDFCRVTAPGYYKAESILEAM